MKKIIFCHLPKTGGYSFLNWMNNQCSILEFNDTARSLSDTKFVESYNSSNVIEIHGGNPESLVDRASRCGIDIFADNLVVTIVRNPVSQYESLWRVAHENSSYLDLPIAVRNISHPGLSLSDFYSTDHSLASHSIDDCYELYERHHTLISLSPTFFSSQEESRFLDTVHHQTFFLNELRMNKSNMNYLFRRDPQTSYINNTLGSGFLANYISPSTSSLAQRSCLIYLLCYVQKIPGFSLFTIFDDIDFTFIFERSVVLTTS